MRLLKNKKNKVSLRWRGGEKGQTLVEMVFALGVAVLVIVALVAATTFAVRNAQFARNESLASKYGQEEMELVRAFRDKNGLANLSCGGNCYIDNSLALRNGQETLSGGFTRSFAIVSPATGCPAGAKKVVVTVSWTDSKGIHQAQPVSCFTQWQ